MRISSFTLLLATVIVSACGDDTNPKNDSTGSGAATSTGTTTGTTSTVTSTTATTTSASTSGETTSSGSSGSSSSASGTGGGGGSPPTGPCPTTPPADGDACTTDELGCSWGTDIRYGCRIAAVCNSGQWTRFPPNGTWNCPMPEPQCPLAAPGDGDGCTDTELGLTCIYNHTAYTCANCNGNLCFPDNTWFQSDLDPACPDSHLPNLGDACTPDGLECNYNHCSDDQEMTHGWVHGVALGCEGGLWTLANLGFCP